MSGPGIDYGMGLSNIDEETGIRYGIISQHSVCPEAMDDVYNNGTDLAWEGDKEELTKQLSAALYEVLEDTSLNEQRAKDIAQESAEALVDDIAGDALDNSGESGPFQYEQDGYQLQTTMNNELFVLKSPYYTYAKFCSPCVPGAGSLDSTAKTVGTEEELSQYGVKTYCLDGSWFEGGVAPYPVFRVKESEKK